MKKFAAISLSLLLCLSVMPALAASVWGGLGGDTSPVVYDVPDLHLSLTVPDSLLVYTRDMPEDDPALKELGVDKAFITDHFINNNIYFNAVIPQLLDEFICTMQPNAVNSLDIFSQAQLEAMIPQLVEQYESIGATLISCEIFDHPQTKMFKMLYNHPGNAAQAMQYYVVRNNQAIGFSFNAYGGEITQEYEDLLTGIVMSVQFEE